MRFILTFTIAILFTATAHAEHRVALLIANHDYGEHKLTSPPSDVKAVAKVIEELGFRTNIAENLNREQLKTTIERFVAAVPTRGTALVYFAGYALEGQNNGQRDSFLIPVAEELRSDRDVGAKGYGVQQLLQKLQEESGSSANLVFVDGCYAWPGELRDVPAGLMGVREFGPDTIVWHGAKAGEVVDTDQQLSPLAKNFANVVRAIRGQDGGSRLSDYYVASSLNDADCLDADLATVSVSPPDNLSEGRRAGDEWVNAQGMVFCWCPAGRFEMGSPESEQGRLDDESQVDVSLSRGFWMAKYETTKRECTRSPRNSIATHKNHPIDYVHYDDFRAYLRSLNESERKAGRLPSSWEYDLPSEAEWEYACRAGNKTAFSFGDDASQLPAHGNFADRTLLNARDDYHSYAHRHWDDGVAYLAAVGSYPPNPWGLCDMHGNVWEICRTRYSRERVGGTDPAGPKDGPWVARGGSWASLANYCRSAFRHHYSSRDEQHWLGYRLVRRKTK